MQKKHLVFLFLAFLLVGKIANSAERGSQTPFLDQWNWQGVQAVCGGCEQPGDPFPGFTWEYDCTLFYKFRPSPGVSVNREIDLYNSFSNSTALYYRSPWVDGAGWYSWDALSCTTRMCPPPNDERMCLAIDNHYNDQLPHGPNPDGGVVGWLPTLDK